MFNNNYKSENKIFKSECDNVGVIAVRCRKIEGAKTGINYLINIEDYAGGITVLLDNDGNSMLSQLKL